MRSTDGDHREIRRGIVYVSIFVLLGKFAAAAKEMVVAWRYGVSANVDVYLFMFNLVNWPISLWLALLTSMLIPVLARGRASTVPHLDRFRAELTGRTLIGGVAMAALAAVALAALLESSLSGLPPDSRGRAFGILLPMVLLLPCGWMIGLFSVAMLTTGRHVNTLLESVPAVVIAAVVAIVAKPSIELLAWATLAGFLCHVVALAIPLRGELQAPRYSAEAPQWSEFWAGFSIMLLGQFLTGLSVVADQLFAARLSAGALASMGYAQRILALIIGLGATAVGRAAIPVLARATDAQRVELRATALYWVRLVFGLGLLAFVLGWVLAPWGVRLLFERGAFTPDNTRAVVAVLRMGLFQMPFNFSAVLLFYALAGSRQYVAITVIAAVALVIKLLANSLLVPTWGTGGVMISTALMYATLMSLYLYLLRKTDR